MSNHKEQRSQPIRLTSDGELWGLPTAEDVQQQKSLQEAAAEERKKLAEELQKDQEKVMAGVLQRLAHLNAVCEKKLFFEMIEKDKKALISRTPLRQETESGQEDVYLVVGNQGFYALRMPVISEDLQEKLWKKYEKSESFRQILEWGAKIEFKYQYVVPDKDELRIAMSGELTGRYGLDLVHAEADLPLMTEEDEWLIQASLDHSLSVVREEQQKRDVQSESEEERLLALQKQVALVHRIQGIIPEPIQIQDTTQSLSWLQRFFQKKKKSK